MDLKMQKIIDEGEKKDVSLFENFRPSILGEEGEIKATAYLLVKSGYDFEIVINSSSFAKPMLIGSEEEHLNREFFVHILDDNRVLPALYRSCSFNWNESKGITSYIYMVGGRYADDSRYSKMEWKTIKDSGIDDKIDEWHKSDSNLPLHEFLGMTEEEYAKWVESKEE